MNHKRKNHRLTIILPLIAGFLFSCVRESPTVNPADIVIGGGSVTTGYYYPEVVNVYPANGSNGNPVNTKYVIVFNIPINDTTLSANITVSSSSLGALTEVVHYNIVPGPSPVTIVTIEFTGGMNPIPNNDTISINIGAGIQTPAPQVASLNNPGVRTFSVGTAADSTAPSAVLASRSPAPGSINISRTAPGISIQFNEANDIDVSTLHSGTFYCETTLGGKKVPATIGYVSATKTATLTPTETLEKNTQYTVYVTTGVKDLAGNALSAATNWSFTTVNTEIDPVPGAPTISAGIDIDAVTTTTASLSWITNEATNYTLHYGRNNDGSGSPDISDLATYTSLHSATLNALTPGKRYYAKVDYVDLGGTSGATSAVKEFNTLTTEAPATLDGGVNNQHTAKAITNKWGVAASGAFIFWTDETSGNKHLYAQSFNNAPAAQWGAGGKALGNNAGTNYFYLNTVEDETGGFIVLYSIGGSGVYAKRFDSSGTIVNWGASSDDTTKTGITIDAAGTNPSAVPVYTNTVKLRTSGTATHGSMALPNWFFEDDFDLLSSVADGDIVYDTDNKEGTTIDINSTTPDFRHIIGQDGVQAVSKAAAENYIIGDGATNDTFTARNHDMNVNPDYLNGTNKVYSPHGYTPPAWLGAGDIIQLGTNFKRITAINLISVMSIQSGTANARLANNLVDADANFTNAPSVGVGDLVLNTITHIFAAIVNFITNIITLNYDSFTLGNENYEIYDNHTKTMQPIVTGNANTDSTDHLVDTSANFATRVKVGDFARNNTTGLYAKITNVTATDLTLEWDAFPNGNEPYSIFDNTITTIVSGTANSTFANHLVDTSNNFISAGIQSGDIVFNTTDGTFASVTDVTKYVLQLDWDAFNSKNENYVIYDNTPALIPLAVGTADSKQNKHLKDSTATFSSTLNVNINDFALNDTDKLYATITGVADFDLNLDFDAFPDGNEAYRIIDNTPAMTPLASGTYTASFTNRLIDASADFVASGVLVGDEVKNSGTDYANITEVTSNVLVLDANIITTGEAYTVLDNSAEMTKIRNAAAGARWTDRLFDASATFKAAVTTGDLVIDTTDSVMTTVSSVPEDNTIVLASDIFDKGTENYVIYHNYCTTHTSIDSFYEFVLDGNLNAADSDSITLYDYKGISGTSDIPPANPLFDDAADFTTADINKNVANNDIALNFTDKLWATVTTATYALTARALDLTANIFTDADVYSIIRFLNTNTTASDIITVGAATAYTANHLIDSSNSFAAVSAGDVVVNLTDNTYAIATNVAANDLTLSRDIFDTGNERYLIYRRRGVLYVWQAAGPLVRGRIMNIEAGAAPVNLRAPWTIANGSNPTAISDGMGNALVVYNDTTAPSQIMVQKLDGTGASTWGPVAIDSQIAAAETIQLVQSDNAGGMIVLYSYSGSLYVQRIDANGNLPWGATGQAIGNPAAFTQVDMAYVGGNDVIVVANINNDIWARRVGTTNWAGYVSNPSGTQQNPKIFLNGADTIIVWEDDRFASFSGRGIFGIKINAATGDRNPGWYAAANNTDLNGVAFVLNDFNEYWSNILLVPYNNGAGALLFWEDYRTPGEGINLIYSDITSFTP